MKERKKVRRGITHDDAGQKDSIGVVDVGGIEEPQNGSGSTPEIAKAPGDAARRNRGESALNEMIFRVKRSNDANDAVASTSVRCRQEVECDADDAALFSSLLLFLSIFHFLSKETTSRHPLSSICFRRRRRRRGEEREQEKELENVCRKRRKRRRRRRRRRRKKRNR